MASTRDGIADIWGPRTPTLGSRWPVRVDRNVEEEPDRWVQACCFLCSNGCGIDIAVKDDRPGGRIVGVRGREADVVNRGRLGPKGLYGWVANASPDRLTRPLVRRGSRLEPASWDEAMDLIVRRMKEAKEKYTAGSIGFYTSGQLFAEANYTLSVIRTAGIGTLHIDGNTRLCTATAGAALKETFGADGQPGTYGDVDVADCFLFVGHDMAATATVLWARVLDRRRGDVPSKMIVIDPRRTATAAEADLHIKPRLGTNVAVLNGLIRELIAQGHADRAFIEAHTLGYDELSRTVDAYTPERVAEIAQIPAGQLREAAAMIGGFAELTGGSGIPWPCNERHPEGSDRYYADLRFATDPDYCESYGHDLLTGAAITEADYRARKPDGRAFLRAAEYVPPTEEPDEDYPFFLSTGRVVYHFHTRTKTGRAKELREAAPDAFIQLSEEDASRLGIGEGEMLRVTSRRGAAEAPARIGDIEPGTLFMPFHYGYWDDPHRARAANELTLYEWDPVSKQPHFKYAAVRLEKAAGKPLPQPEETGREEAAARAGPSGRRYLADYMGLLLANEDRLIHGGEKLCAAHPKTPDIRQQGALFGTWTGDNLAALRPFEHRYGARHDDEPAALDKALSIGRPATGFGLRRDLQDLWLMVNESAISVAVLIQAARALGDGELETALRGIESRNERQRSWLFSRIRQAAPQVLAVPGG